MFSFKKIKNSIQGLFKTENIPGKDKSSAFEDIKIEKIKEDVKSVDSIPFTKSKTFHSKKNSIQNQSIAPIENIALNTSYPSSQNFTRSLNNQNSYNNTKELTINFKSGLLATPLGVVKILEFCSDRSFAMENKI